jgi:PAS domain S-box-containing protein
MRIPIARRLALGSSPFWIRFGSLATLLIATTLLSTSLLRDVYRSSISTALVPALLVAQGLAICLTAYALRYFWTEHQRTDRAFCATDCEATSIFQNVLDGILILDDHALCLDGNPAAARILRISRSELIGKSIAAFGADSGSFSRNWMTFLQRKNHRGRAELVAGDGTIVFVDFTAATNYLPGRHIIILCDVTEHMRAEEWLRRSEERFRHMADNIQEIFWMMDASTKEVIYVNRAYATITGRSIESLYESPPSYRELIHPQDRIRVLSRLQETVSSGIFDEEFRFTRADGTVRWIWAKGFPVPSDGETRWLVGTAHDTTARKQAEMKISEQLDAVKAARAEAEALRKSTLALSQNLAMDSVLDTLLQCISELVPFDRATVIFVEDGPELMVAREVPRVNKRIGLTFAAEENILLQRVLFERKAILLPNVANDSEWRDVQPLDRLQSWLGVPLVAAGNVLGILSLGTKAPCLLTTEHLRLAKSLAVPASVAIQNARIHERAEIYSAELEIRLQELRETQKALDRLGSNDGQHEV